MKNQIIFKNEKEVIIPNDNSVSKVYKSGNYLELITMQNQPSTLQNYRRVGGRFYTDIRTGETNEYNKSSKRTENPHGINKSMHELRRIINLNFAGDNSELHITLTYSEQVTDTEKVYSDFKKFWSRLKYRYPSCEYISVIEPQENGSWHIHMLVKASDNKILFIPYIEISKIWGHGYIYVTPIKNVSNLGVYFVSSICDIKVKNKNGTDSQSKSVIKGGRLHFYPAKCRLYRCSRGIKRVIPEKMEYREAKALVSDYSQTYASTKSIVQRDSLGNETRLNAITYEQYIK